MSDAERPEPPPRPLLSSATIGAIADLAKSEPEVERLLAGVGLSLAPMPVSRHHGTVIVPNVSQRLVRTLSALDLSDRTVVNSVLTVAEKLAETYAAAPGSDCGRLVRLRERLAADGFFLSQSGDPLAAIRGLAADAAATLPDASAVRAELVRLEKSLDDDPSRDIGTAKRLIESTAKIIIVRNGLSFGKNSSMPWLVDTAMQCVGIAPVGKPEAVSDMLMSLKDLALTVNRLRNKAGDGHGGTTAVTAVDARDSRMAVRAAISLSPRNFPSSRSAFGRGPVDF